MKSEEIFNESKKYMPGGVNSPVRAYKDLNINPPIIKRGEGSHIFDEDGNEYIDFVGAWGPMILGHSDKEVSGCYKRYFGICNWLLEHQRKWNLSLQNIYVLQLIMLICLEW